MYSERNPEILPVFCSLSNHHPRWLRRESTHLSDGCQTVILYSSLAGISLLSHLFVHCLMLQLSQIWPVKTSSDWPLFPFDSFHWTFPYFLAQDVLGSSCVFPAQALQLAISPRTPDSFWRRRIFRNKELGASIVVNKHIATGISLLPARKYYVHQHPHLQLLLLTRWEGEEPGVHFDASNSIQHPQSSQPSTFPCV